MIGKKLPLLFLHYENMKHDLQDKEKVLHDIFKDDTFILASLSQPRKGNTQKITIRPIDIKGKQNFQITEFQGDKAIHKNFLKHACLEWLKEQLDNFGQSFFYTLTADYHFLFGKKGNFTILKKPPSKSRINLSHNRQKKYLIEEGSPIPFMIHLGLMNQEGKVYPAKMDKFRQINRFYEMIDDILQYLDITKKLNIVDVGCGKAYLTFSLYYFLKIMKGYDVSLFGFDLKHDVIQFCQDLAKNLHYGDIQFTQGDINTVNLPTDIDMVVSLHACDTATDAAIEKGIRCKAKVILSVPCCQHELINQIEQDSLNPILRHGILKERFSAIATDAARAQLLDILGYQTQIMEFIDLEHTAKNLLIRSVRSTQKDNNQKAKWNSYLKFKKALNISPSLEKRFHEELYKI